MPGMRMCYFHKHHFIDDVQHTYSVIIAFSDLFVSYPLISMCTVLSVLPRRVIENSDMNKTGYGILHSFQSMVILFSRTGDPTHCVNKRIVDHNANFIWLFQRVCHLKWELNFVHLCFRPTRFHIGRLSRIGVRTHPDFQDLGLRLLPAWFIINFPTPWVVSYSHAPVSRCIFLFLSTNTFRTLELESYHHHLD